jgi:hypothetical protein
MHRLEFLNNAKKVSGIFEAERCKSKAAEARHRKRRAQGSIAIISFYPQTTVSFGALRLIAGLHQWRLQRILPGCLGRVAFLV